MRNNKLTYHEQFKIRASEVDVNQKATLPAICNLLQEIAGNHARELQVDITDLQQNKLTWVLHRLHVKMERFPHWRETITIMSWPSGGDGVRAHRDFLIQDAGGETIGRSLSYWLILDIQSRRPNRIPAGILESVPPKSEHVLPLEKGDFSQLEQVDSLKTFEVRKTDLDLNKHLNNVRYVEWALACLPESVKPHNIAIKFMAEAVLGDIVTAEHRSVDQDGQQFQIKRDSDDKILALAYST